MGKGTGPGDRCSRCGAHHLHLIPPRHEHTSFLMPGIGKIGTLHWLNQHTTKSTQRKNKHTSVLMPCIGTIGAFYGLNQYTTNSTYRQRERITYKGYDCMCCLFIIRVTRRCCAAFSLIFKISLKAHPELLPSPLRARQPCWPTLAGRASFSLASWQG